MPHCILHITKNLSPSLNYENLMRDLAKAINISNIFINDDIKIRLFEIEHSFMGIEKQGHSYIAAEIVLLKNKSHEQYCMIQNSVQKVLTGSFKDVSQKLRITTRITFVDPEYYVRTVNY